MDWSYIFGFSNFNKIQDIPTLGVDGKKSTFFSAISFGRNVFLVAHKDQDYGYSVVLAMSPEESVRQNEEVLCYFVFPELGHKVALRNLDILIFNPQEYHCVSKKVVDSDVFVLSLYM